MAGFTHETATFGKTYNISADEAWNRNTNCPNCGSPLLFVVGFRRGQPNSTYWLFCLRCNFGCVTNQSGSQPRKIAPGDKKYPTPDGVPPEEEALWEEIRERLSVQASTAVAMLCRKMLLHLAYTHDQVNNPSATPPSNFVQAVDYLKNNNLIPVQHHDWVNQIRLVGNEANHELPQINEATAEDIALFTHNLLVTLYELPARANIPSPMQQQPPAPGSGQQ